MREISEAFLALLVTAGFLMCGSVALGGCKARGKPLERHWPGLPEHAKCGPFRDDKATCVADGRVYVCVGYAWNGDYWPTGPDKESGANCAELVPVPR